MVDMNERLAQFMRAEQLTAAKLAEIVQVQPSSISHLLSGRNKPNFDFIARMLRMFATLNPDWLINGIGEMYRTEKAEKPHLDPNRLDLAQKSFDFAENKPEQQINQNVPSETILDTNVKAVGFEQGERLAFGQPQQEPYAVHSSVTPPVVPMAEDPGALLGVRHVVVLFEDQTCVVYKNRTTP